MSRVRISLRDGLAAVVIFFVVVFIVEFAIMSQRFWTRKMDIALPSPPKPPSLFQAPVRPAKEGVSSPLSVVDFDSTHSLILANSSNSPIFVLSFVVSIRSENPQGDESVSYPLNSEIGPHKLRLYNLRFDGSFDTAMPTERNWDRQWSASYSSYAQGCIRVAFYIPSSPKLRQQLDHFSAAGTPWPIGHTVGVLKYTISASNIVKETHIPVDTILLKRQGCQLNQ